MKGLLIHFETQSRQWEEICRILETNIEKVSVFQIVAGCSDWEACLADFFRAMYEYEMICLLIPKECIATEFETLEEIVSLIRNKGYRQYICAFHEAFNQNNPNYISDINSIIPGDISLLNSIAQKIKNKEVNMEIPGLILREVIG